VKAMSLLARALGCVKRVSAQDRQPRSAVVGAWGEERAAAFLKGAGYDIIGRNVRPNRRDEIDIIARRDDFLVFVEV